VGRKKTTPAAPAGNSKLNGPQVALAFDLEGLDSHASRILLNRPLPQAVLTCALRVAGKRGEQHGDRIKEDAARFRLVRVMMDEEREDEPLARRARHVA